MRKVCRASCLDTVQVWFVFLFNFNTKFLFNFTHMTIGFYNIFVLVNFLLLWQIHDRNKDLLCLLLLEVSVHCKLAPLFLDCGEAEYPRECGG